MLLISILTTKLNWWLTPLTIDEYTPKTSLLNESQNTQKSVKIVYSDDLFYRVIQLTIKEGIGV